MEIKAKTEIQHHCKLVEWDSVSALGCTPIKQNATERDFNIEEHNKAIYNQAIDDALNVVEWDGYTLDIKERIEQLKR